MKRKQDRFDRMVLAELKLREHGPGDPCLWLIGPEVVELLRQYHREVVELVEQVQACIDSPYGHGRYDMRDDILTKLKEFTK